MRRVARQALRRYREMKEEQDGCAIRACRVSAVRTNVRYFGRPREEWLAEVWLAAKRVLDEAEFAAWVECALGGKDVSLLQVRFGARNRKTALYWLYTAEAKLGEELVRCGIA
jgi:hypothetical protein